MSVFAGHGMPDIAKDGSKWVIHLGRLLATLVGAEAKILGFGLKFGVRTTRVKKPGFSGVVVVVSRSAPGDRWWARSHGLVSQCFGEAAGSGAHGSFHGRQAA